MPTYPWNHPTGWIRHGPLRPAASTRRTSRTCRSNVLRERHLDPYDVTLGIVEPDEAAAFSIIPNAQLAARLCSAYNDWLLERWLAGGAAPARDDRRSRAVAGGGGRARSGGSGGGTSSSASSSPAPRASPTATRPTTRSGRRRTSSGSRSPCTRTTRASASRSPITAAGMPDYYAEYHTLCGSGMYGHFVSILCHGIFERFPDTRVAMVEGGLVPFVGLLWRLDTNWKACRSEIPWCRRRPSEYIWDHVRFATQPLESPDDPAQLIAAIEFLRPADDAHVRERLPALGLRRARADPPAAAGGMARQRRWPERAGVLPAARRSRRLSEWPSEKRACRSPTRRRRGDVLMLDLGGHRVGLYRVEGTLHALADRCPHRGAPLCCRQGRDADRGRGRRARARRAHSIVRCPWHKWEFDIATGRCARRRQAPGAAVRRAGRRRRGRRHPGSSMTRDCDVVVVGGGIAGLAAAWHLRDRDVVVLEASERLGGRIRSERRGAYWLNFGAHVFAGPGSASRRLIDEVGVETRPGSRPARRRLAQRQARLERPCRALSLPSAAASRRSSGARPGGCPAASRVRRYAAVAREARASRPPSGNSGCSSSWTTGRSRTSWAGSHRTWTRFSAARSRARRRAREARRGLRGRYFHLVWNRGEGLSTNIVGGSSTLIERIAAELGERALTNARVERVTPVDGGIVVASAAGEFRARSAIVAAPAYVAPRDRRRPAGGDARTPSRRFRTARTSSAASSRARRDPRRGTTSTRSQRRSARSGSSSTRAMRCGSTGDGSRVAR